jgi:hypothetical protein
LVDWRNAPAPIKRQLIWVTDWNPPLEGGVRVRVPPDRPEFARERGSFRVNFNEAYHRWLLHLSLLLGIVSKTVDSGTQRAYRWHSGRLFTDPHRGFEAQCLACGDRTEWRVLYIMPHACPACGFDEIVLPGPWDRDPVF